MRNSFFTIPGAFATEKIWKEISILASTFWLMDDEDILLAEFVVAGDYTPDWWAAEINGFSPHGNFQVGGVVIDGDCLYLADEDVTVFYVAIWVFVGWPTNRESLMGGLDYSDIDYCKLWVAGDTDFYPDMPVW